jgi:ribonucleoside-diphosphate reductase alpha subunit
MDSITYNTNMDKIQVHKRDGAYEDVSFDKIMTRIMNICKGDANLAPLPNVDYVEIAKKTISGLVGGMETSELDNLAASVAQPLAIDHPDYGHFASRISISNIHKSDAYLLRDLFNGRQEPSMANSHKEGIDVEEIRLRQFYWVARALFENVDDEGNRAPLIAPDVYAFVCEWADELEAMIDYRNDYLFDYTGISQLRDGYLKKVKIGNARVVVERPQHMFMRVALGIWVAFAFNDVVTRGPNEPRCINWKAYLTNNEAIWAASRALFAQYIGPHTLAIFDREVVNQTINWSNLTIYLSQAANRIGASRANRAKAAADLAKVEAMIAENKIGWDGLVMKIRARLRRDDAISWANEVMIRISETYEMMSAKYATHATPTLFNSASLIPQLSSCFLLGPGYDSLDSITELWKNISMIQKTTGGVGSHIHNIRASGSLIRTSGGQSNGITPMIKVMDSISEYIDQGGLRPGSHKVALEPWHPDILEFIKLKRPLGNGAKALFYAIWASDEFFRTVLRENEIMAKTGVRPELWGLICPDKAQVELGVGLQDLYDAKFRTTWINDEELEAIKDDYLFTYYYRGLIGRGEAKMVSASKILYEIIATMTETGTPDMMAKDACNRKSNQKHCGTIKSSNLCAEIIELTTPEEIAVCNLASICLPKYATRAKTGPKGRQYGHVSNAHMAACEGFTFTGGHMWFDYDSLERVIRIIVRNINQVIDVEYYPDEKARYSNMRHRPMGIGIQGLADLYNIFRIPFDSEEAMKLNVDIAEFMYYVAVHESCELAKIHGHYETFPGSPLSEGKFQFDLWAEEGHFEAKEWPLACDWAKLRQDVIKYGTRNSLFIAKMPTSSTSTIMNNSPSFEPHGAIFYKRRAKFGEFIQVNKYLIDDLMQLGLWGPSIRNKILASNKGSIQDIEEIPKEIRDIYKIAWDISPKVIINQAATSGPFVDQSQSMNIFIPAVNTSILSQVIFAGWRRGLKTLNYYIRQLAATDAQKTQIVAEEVKACKRDDPDCKSCGS